MAKNYLFQQIRERNDIFGTHLKIQIFEAVIRELLFHLFIDEWLSLVAISCFGIIALLSYIFGSENVRVVVFDDF